MAIYVKSGGTWREISSSAGGQVYVRDATSFTNKTIINGYIKDGSTWRTVFTLFETPTGYTTASDGAAFAVPTNANAIHIQSAVGGGGGGFQGADYDKAGGESAGAGGASGGYISDRVYTVTGGETLTPSIGASGAADTSGGRYSGSSSPGGSTLLTGGTTGTLFTLGGGGGSSASGGGVQGPLRTNTAGASGTISQGTSLSSGTTVDGLDITSFNSGTASSFNAYGTGAQGTNPGNCSGDNCSITGGTGGLAYNGNGAVGTSGAGGNGGNHPLTGGIAGTIGQMIYRFLRIA